MPRAGSSPLTRGTPNVGIVDKGTNRFIPAYAGNSRGAVSVKELPAVHPRLRGELKIGGRHQITVFGSSPLTRGTPCQPPDTSRCLRFIPAYAGNSKDIPTYSLIFSVHPRLRGELNGDPSKVSLRPVHPRLRGELGRFV